MTTIAQNLEKRVKIDFLEIALSARGITPEQHRTKMNNLKALGCVRIFCIEHDKYLVDKHPGKVYNPYINEWSVI